MTVSVDQIHHTITTIFGDTIADTISGVTVHSWTADANGLFHTTTDLAQEWQADYAQMKAGHGDTLTALQRLEGNAEAVFENTGLSKLSTTQQAIDREDVQRQFDAMAAVSPTLTTVGGPAFTETTYLSMEHALQGDKSLEELGMQGHGLNNSGAIRYAGFTNDFQNNVDNTTLFIGGGILNNNAKALADFFDDNILSHAPFAVVAENGKLVQLNQNGAAENTMNQAIVALNDTAFSRVYTSADFSAHHSTTATDKITDAKAYTAADNAALKALQTEETASAPAGEVKTRFGELISNTMTAGEATGTQAFAHTWTAGADGLFHTSNLAEEWHNAYVDLVTTGGHHLTAEQRLEANAESAFENTKLATLDAGTQQRDREDAQREFDAEFSAMKLAGIDPNAQITAASYLAIEHTLQGNAALEELAIQGHGLNNPGNPRYNGYTNDFQHNVDKTTKFIGGGHDNKTNALADFFDDCIMTHMPFPTVVVNGKLIQLNQNGAHEDILSVSVTEMNTTIHKKAYDADDYLQA